MKRLLIAISILSVLLWSACAGPSEPKVLPYPGEGAPPPPAGYTYDLPPEPIPTPEPVPTEQPALTSAERAYASAIVEQADTIGKALSELGELLQNPQIGNDEWTLQVATQIVIIRGVYDEAMELTPPTSMAEIHLKYTQALKHFNDSTYLLTQGIDELDPSLLEEATTEMEIGTQLINEATQLTLEFNETHE